MQDIRFYKKAPELLRKLYEKYDDGYWHCNLEPIPKNGVRELMLNGQQAHNLQLFAKANPYLNFHSEDSSDERFYLYEYVKPNNLKESLFEYFAPTWTLSAWLVSNLAKDYGCKEIVDIGSGYGSFQYCGKLLGLGGRGIEIDRRLIETQREISQKTKVQFESLLADATKLNYKMLNCEKPAFILPYEDEFTDSVLSHIKKFPEIYEKAMFIFWGYPVDRSEWNVHVELGLPTHFFPFVIYTLATKK
jgi:SAM-dependent methyltransferase